MLIAIVRPGKVLQKPSFCWAGKMKIKATQLTRLPKLDLLGSAAIQETER
jgi:hypothetical protein